MVSGAYSRKALEHRICSARLVQAWKKRSKGKRESLAKLAIRIGLTLSQTRSLVTSRPKKQDVTRQKIRLIREAARRTAKSTRQGAVASTALAKACKITLVSTRTISRMHRPYRAKRLQQEAKRAKE